MITLSFVLHIIYLTLLTLLISIECQKLSLFTIMIQLKAFVLEQGGIRQYRGDSFTLSSDVYKATGQSK